jgi:hypothetical protein
VSARYWVLVTDELFASEYTTWPPGMVPVLDLADRKLFYGQGTPAHELAPMHWQLFSDDAADQELEGHKVSITLRVEDGKTFVDRRMIE